MMDFDPAGAAPPSCADAVMEDGPPQPPPVSPPGRSSLNDFHADVVLHVVRFLNVVDSSHLSATSKRFFYLVDQYRTAVRGPELVTVASWKGTGGGGRDNGGAEGRGGQGRNIRRRGGDAIDEQWSTEDLARQAIHGLQGRPNLVLTFSKNSEWVSGGGFPRDAVLLGATASSIQVNHPVPPSSSNSPPSPSPVRLEHKSDRSLMACHFPGATILPFCMQSPSAADFQDLRRRLDEESDAAAAAGVGGGTAADSPYWKAIIVYACGAGSDFVDQFIASMQPVVPIIVGGICEGGYVSRPGYRWYSEDELRTMSVQQLCRLTVDSLGRIGTSASVTGPYVEKSNLVAAVARDLDSVTARVLFLESGIFGVVLGGEAPVRSIVSRGVTSLVQPDRTPQGRSRYVVHRAETLFPTDERYMFRGANGGDGSELLPAHVVWDLLDTETGSVHSFEHVAQKLAARGHQPDFIGLRRRPPGGDGCDGFELFMVDPYTVLGSFVFMTDGSPHMVRELGVDETEVDFFCLNGDACLLDMDSTVDMLRDQTRGEDILGAVMFSCNGRGPRPGGLIREAMADATRFHRGFPAVPCLGFYANGEIGPMALAGNENVFRSGRATVQGYTAVFALFIVPRVDKQNYRLDDSSNSIDAFIASRLLGSTPKRDAPHQSH